jgi:hypothetical protein
MASDSFNFLINLTIPLRDYYFSPSLASMDLKLLDDLESQINKTIEQTQSELAERTCCIYNLPSTLLATNNNEAYHPRVVSIGPRHINHGAVKGMEKHKLEFLADLLKRKNLVLNDLLESLRPLDQEKARECYSKEINLGPLNDDHFLKMMVLDGCFLLELFLKAHAADKKRKDPLFQMSTGTFFCLRIRSPFLFWKSYLQLSSISLMLLKLPKCLRSPMFPCPFSLCDSLTK